MNQWFEVKTLETELGRILNRLRQVEELRTIVGRKQVKANAEEWIGVAGKNEFWAGFGISKLESGPTLYAWVEITVAGDQRKKILSFDRELKAAFDYATALLTNYHKEYGAVNCRNLSDGKDSRFVFAKPISNDGIDQGETVYQWLKQTSEAAIALAQAETRG